MQLNPAERVDKILLKKTFLSNGASYGQKFLNRVCCALSRKGVHTFTVHTCIHETWSGQVSAHCWPEQEPYAPFLSGGDVRSGSKPWCIFNESLTSSVSPSHYLSCQCLLHPHLHGTPRKDRKQRMPLSLTNAFRNLNATPHPS